MHHYHPSTGVIEEEESEIQGHPVLHIEFQASLGYMRHCLQERKEETLKQLYIKPVILLKITLNYM